MASAESLPDVSVHAAGRMVQRGIGPDEIDLAMGFGQMLYKGGAAIFFMGRRQAERCASSPRDVERLEGVTVVTNSVTHEIITVYRNACAPRRVRRQSSYRKGR